MTAQGPDRPAPETTDTDDQPESWQQSKTRYAAWANRLKVEQRERVASTHPPGWDPEATGPTTPEPAERSADDDTGADAGTEAFDMGQLMRESNEWTAANRPPTDADD